MKDALKRIQKSLTGLGLYTGLIDGVIGFSSYSSIVKLRYARSDKELIKIVTSSKGKNLIKEIQEELAENRVYFGDIDGDFGNASITAFNKLLPAPKLTDQKIKLIYPNAKAGFAEYINSLASDYGVVTKADMFAFLANNLHESAGFNSLRENVNYKASRLLVVFPKYFKSMASAQAIVNQGQVAICDVIYGGRMGNVKGTDDGYKYRGGGTIHLTGRNNYTACSKAIKEPELLSNPDIITKPEYAMKTALWFWSVNSCSLHANNGDFEKVCVVVNGGKNGLPERIALHKKAWNSLF